MLFRVAKSCFHYENVEFREQTMSDSDTPKEYFLLKLTKRQWSAILQSTQLSEPLKLLVMEASQDSREISATRGELDELLREIERTSVAPGVHQKELRSALKKLSNLMEAIRSGEISGDRTLRGQLWDPALKLSQVPGPILQFKISLINIEPEIWRRIQIPDCTLGRLHDYIQAIFNWDDDHLHQFKVNGVVFGVNDPYGTPLSSNPNNEHEVKLTTLLSSSKKRIQRWFYEYDFGDGWGHEILFEGYPEIDPQVKYPLCVDGARAGPPEDCGGAWSYCDIVDELEYRKSVEAGDEADDDNDNDNDDDDMGGMYGDLDPEKFDIEWATKNLQRIV